MMAAFGFKGFGWFLCTAIVAPGCYLVTSQVAAERGRVESVQRAIAEAHRDIRDLDTEIKTRANMAQLERWNGDLLALASPRPDQFLDAGAQGVAELENGGRPDGPVAYASLVVPHAPVLTDGPGTPDAAPEAALEVKEPEARAAAPSPAPAPRAEPRRSAPVATASLGSAKDRTVAMLDERLLSESTLGDLMRGARAEAKPH